MCGFGNQRMVGVFSLSLFLSALLQMRTTRLCVTRAQSSFACTTSVVRLAFVNFVIFWIIHKMIRWYLSLFIRKLTLFLSSFTPAKQQILQGRVVLQDRRFCPDCLVRFQCVFFILFYPFVRSFVRRSGNTTEGSKSFKQSSRKKKRIKIIYDSSKPNGTPRKLLDISLAKKYGWKAKTDLKDAIKKTYLSFLKDNSI